MLKVNASICPECLALIFSRARHDFHWCPCKGVYIDGGFDYMRSGWVNEFPYQVTYEIPQSKDELYQDYNLRTDRFGIIQDWKMSIIDFFNAYDGRCIKAFKQYAEENVWPQKFPIDHLTFPEGWVNNLVSRVLTALAEKKEQKNG